MGYQALLFCPDEKLGKVVTQVFNELDFTVEAVHEPFAAVKKLMAQHYDALVVDSENDQNASLLFKSARNSSFNQSSLAIALVEGQIGVAKAYRIGANLVLTKPINVEQAKGTLRVARGLLRKHSDTSVPGTAMGTAMAAAATPVESPAPVNATPREPATAASPHHSPLGELATPAALASAALSAEYAKHFPTEFAGEFPELNAASGEENHGSVLIPPGSTATPVTAPPAAEAQRGIASPRTQTAVASEPAIRGTAALAAQAAPSQPTRSAPTAGTGSSPAGSATAPAPAKEPTAPSTAEKKNRIVEAEPASGNTSLATVSRIDPGNIANAPSFAALGEPDAAQSGSGKRILIAAIVLALAVLGYFGYAKFGTSSAVAPAVQPANAPPDSSKPAPTLQPMSAPDQSPAKSNSTTLASQSSKTAADSSSRAAPASAPNSAMRTPENTAAPATSETRSDAAPMLVKTATAAHNAQPKASDRASDRATDKVNEKVSNKAKDKDDESEPLLALASANDGKLASLMSAVSSTVPKPSLATLKISQGVSQGLLIKRVTPAYPKTALAAHVEGEVLIEATINRDGNVTNAKILSGTQVLAQAALDAVRQWRYKPYYLDGTPVDIQTQITVKFKAH